MKKKNILSLTLLAIMTLVSCGTSNDSKDGYTITWKNYDGQVLEVDNHVKKDEMPTYDSNTPTRVEDNQYFYTFKGWSPKVNKVNKNATYYAQYTKTTLSYTVTWKNYDDSILEVDKNVPRFSFPSYYSETPKRISNEQFSYTFIGWDQDIIPVTKDVTFKAEFKRNINYYNVIWKNYDGTILDQSYIPYGETPKYNGETPTKKGDEAHSFSFFGWDKPIVPIIEDTTYTAVFSSSIAEYSVTWKNYDGTILKVDNGVPYGTLPCYDGIAPFKESDSNYSYAFETWKPSIHPVNSNQEYTAVFKQTELFTITWKNYDGEILEVDKDVPYGTIPTYNGEVPVKQKYYEFNGWSPTVGKATSNSTYTATYKLVNETILGMYPQNLVNDEQIINLLNHMVGEKPDVNSIGWINYEDYYVNSTNDAQSYRWYKDIILNDVTYRAVFMTKTPENINGYKANNIYYFRFDPIKWNILDDEGLALSEFILDSGQNFYHDSLSVRDIEGQRIYCNNYQHSDIRNWLNNSFLNTAFAQYEQNEINKTVVENIGYCIENSNNPYKYDNTEDKIFLMNYKEVFFKKNGFTSNSKLLAQATDYAKCMGCFVDYENNDSYWWLRSPWQDPKVVDVVSSDPNYIWDTEEADSSNNGVRPALKLKV